MRVREFQKIIQKLEEVEEWKKAGRMQRDSFRVKIKTHFVKYIPRATTRIKTRVPLPSFKCIVKFYNYHESLFLCPFF